MNIKNKKRAFTLAEVLVTLAIIGVVAALTIPNLILNTGNQERSAKYKETFSIINQALKRLNSDEGTLVGAVDADHQRDILLPYLSTVKKMNQSTSSFYPNANLPYFFSGPVSFWDTTDDSVVVLANGVTLGFYWISPDCTHAAEGLGPVVCGEIDIDLNGVNKGPNKWGQDFFGVWLLKDRILPMGAPGNATFQNTCASSADTGQSCGMNILTNTEY